MKKITIPKLNFSIRAKSNIGLDIGPHSIKVVELQERNGKYVLRNLGVKEIPVMQRGDEKRDTTSIIARLIKDLFAETRIKDKGVVLAVPASKVSIKVIKVPHMPKSELSEAIKWEMRKHLQFPVEDAVLDYSILGTTTENGISKIKLLVAAAQKNAVNEQLAIIKEAGLHPHGVDVIPFAIWKASEGVGATRRVAPTERETVVLVDIGYKRTSISLIADNVLQFTRDATTGSNSLTEALLAPIIVDDTQVRLEYDEAERLKRRYGIPAWDSSERTEENIPLSQIYAMMRPVLEKLLVEVGRSFDFFTNQLHVAKIDKTILSGGGAMIKGLPEFLAQGLGMDVEVTNPFQNMISEVKDVDDEWLHEMSSSFAVAVGLALPAPERINLLPQEIRIKRQKAVQGTVFAIASFILLLIFAALYWNVSRHLSAMQRELSAKRSQLTAMATPETKLPQLRELREKVKSEKTLLPREPFMRYPWTEIIKEISDAVTPKAMLTSVSVDTEAAKVSPIGAPVSPTLVGAIHELPLLIRMKGVIFDKDPDDRIGLNKFIKFMETSPLFTNIRLISTQDTTEYEQAGKRFELVCVPISERKK